MGLRAPRWKASKTEMRERGKREGGRCRTRPARRRANTLFLFMKWKTRTLISNSFKYTLTLPPPHSGSHFASYNLILLSAADISLKTLTREARARYATCIEGKGGGGGREEGGMEHRALADSGDSRESWKKFQKSSQIENNDKLKRPRPIGNPRQARIYTVIIKIYESGTNGKILTTMNGTTGWRLQFADTIYYHAISYDN